MKPLPTIITLVQQHLPFIAQYSSNNKQVENYLFADLVINSFFLHIFYEKEKCDYDCSFAILEVCQTFTAWSYIDTFAADAFIFNTIPTLQDPVIKELWKRTDGILPSVLKSNIL